jgi:uncharacterized protein (DUF362 family)
MRDLMNEQITVCLEQCNSYESVKLKEFFQNTFGTARDFSPRSAKVFIKPNLISSKGPDLACTHGSFLLALAEFLVDNGALVAIGDSPAFGNAQGVLRKLGINGALRKRGIEIVNFNKVVQRRLDCGVNVGIAAEPLNCDYFINAPKVKAHSQMYVTLAVKNIFGIVMGMRKAALHMLHGGADNMFSKILVDLLDHLPPHHFSVIDGVCAMHLTGPIHGRPLNLGCIGFSSDPIALDTSLLHALELDSGKSPLWCETKSRGSSGSWLSNIHFPMQPPEMFHGSHFKGPDELSPVRFNPLRFFWNSLRRAAGYARNGMK